MDNDLAVISRIGELVAEARRLRARVPRGEGLTTEDRHSLAELEAKMEECWEQLRRRRSRRYFGDEANRQSTSRPTTAPRRVVPKRGLAGR
jgi:hypothetical protein